MPILRADMPVSEALFNGEGTLYDKVMAPYELLHSQGSARHSREESFCGYAAELTGFTNFDRVEAHLYPNSYRTPLMGAAHLAIRVVDAETNEVDIWRYVLPGDPDFDGHRLRVGEDGVQELCYGFGPCDGPVPYQNEKFYFVKGLVWVPQDVLNTNPPRTFVG